MGQAVAKRLLTDKHCLFAPVRPDSKSKIADLLPFDNFHVLPGWFYDAELLAQIAEPIDMIIHLAAIRGSGKGSPADYQMVNVQGVKILLDWAKERRIKRFLYVSTVGVLGTIPARLPASAKLKPAPDGLYHQTKYQAEKLVKSWVQQDFKSLILRPTITYGPRDDGFITKMVALVKQKKMIVPNKKVFIHLLDVQAFADLILNVITGDLFNNQIYHVADAEPVLLTSLVNLIQQVKGGRFRVLPAFFFTAGQYVSRLLAMEAFKISLQLISQSWYYDINATLHDLNYMPLNTEQKIRKYLISHVY